jgi:hypothetical protein
MQNNGIVTDACYPYYVPTCPPASQPCLNFVPTPGIDQSFKIIYNMILYYMIYIIVYSTLS